jgi:8-amino-7-oxononanoate synthase
MSNKLEIILQNKLNEAKAKDAYRSLKYNPSLIDFSSNDYLGLASTIEIKEKIPQYLNTLSYPYNGAGGSRLISGHHEYITYIENKIATIHHAEAALLFNSGYNANMGVLSALPQKGDVVLYDEYSHASIKDGIRLSMADKYSFKHNNTVSLETKLEKFKEYTCYVVVESVYSMDGDVAPLPVIAQLCNQYGAILVVDEAHSTGVYGLKGSGLVCQLDLQSLVPIRIHTYGKALGTHGAAVVGSASLKEYLINFSRSFIYTTALPLHSYVSIEVAYDYLAENYKALQEQLTTNILLLQLALQGTEVISWQSPIICKIYEGNERVKEVAATLQKNNFDIRAIISPTVPKGAERLRICLHSFNTEEEIVTLASVLKKA